MSTNTWLQYRTAWIALNEYQKLVKKNFTWPLNNDDIAQFVTFLFYTRNIKIASIYSYLSAIKFLHKLRNYDVLFDTNKGVLSLTLTGIKNFQMANNPGTSLQRRVITFPVLRLLGHEIFSSDLVKHDKLLIWSVSTLAFFTCCRLGEIIFQTKKNFDKTSNFIWKRLKVITMS